MTIELRYVLAWLPMLAFVRLTTKHGLFPSPFRPADAMRRALARIDAIPAVTEPPRVIRIMEQL